MKLTARVSATVQAIGVAVHFLNLNMDIVPAQDRMKVLFIVAGLQAIVGVAQAYYNPDGTEASKAWTSGAESQPNKEEQK